MKTWQRDAIFEVEELLREFRPPTNHSNTRGHTLFSRYCHMTLEKYSEMIRYIKWHDMEKGNKEYQDELKEKSILCLEEIRRVVAYYISECEGN